MAEEGKGEKAKIIRNEKRGFYIHFMIYILVNLFLFIQWYWLTSGEGFAWFMTTTIPWGLGVLAHFIVVFIIGPK
jgi:hypothetical protein